MSPERTLADDLVAAPRAPHIDRYRCRSPPRPRCFSVMETKKPGYKITQWTGVVAGAAAQAAVPLRKKIAQASVTVATVAALSAAPAMAYDVELATEVFEGNCATCHTGGKNVLIPYKTLQKDAIEQYLDGGFNLTAITNQVRTSAAKPCPVDHAANEVRVVASVCRSSCNTPVDEALS